MLAHGGRRMRAIAVLLLAGALSGCGSAGQDEANANEAGALAAFQVEPGLWEVASAVVTARGRNLPLQVRNRLVGPRPTRRYCLTPVQAARPMADLVAGRRGCVYRDLVLDGDRLTGMMGCPEPGAPGPTMARLDGNYGPTGYDLRMEMTSPMPDGTPLTLEVRTRGRRLGACGEGERR